MCDERYQELVQLMKQGRRRQMCNAVRHLTLCKYTINSSDARKIPGMQDADIDRRRAALLLYNPYHVVPILDILRTKFPQLRRITFNPLRTVSNLTSVDHWDIEYGRDGISGTITLTVAYNCLDASTFTEDRLRAPAGFTLAIKVVLENCHCQRRDHSNDGDRLQRILARIPSRPYKIDLSSDSIASQTLVTLTGNAELTGSPDVDKIHLNPFSVIREVRTLQPKILQMCLPNSEADLFVAALIRDLGSGLEEIHFSPLETVPSTPQQPAVSSMLILTAFLAILDMLPEWAPSLRKLRVPVHMPESAEDASLAALDVYRRGQLQVLIVSCDRQPGDRPLLNTARLLGKYVTTAQGLELYDTSHDRSITGQGRANSDSIESKERYRAFLKFINM